MSNFQKIIRLTLFAMHPDVEPESCHEDIMRWFEKWEDEIEVVDHRSGGFEDIWDVLATEAAARECPPEALCDSDWSRAGTGSRE